MASSPSPSAFGVELRRQRRFAGLTQEALAERSGYSVSHIKKLEEGTRFPTAATVDDLATALDLTPDQRARLQEAAAARPPPPTETGHTASPGTLPTPRTSFVGRDTAVTHLCGLLAREDVRLLTLTGPPGVGKTRLALQVAHTLARQRGFPGGVWWVPLGDLDDPDLVPSAIAAALGLRQRKRESPLHTVATSIGDHEMLLVLDRLEHLPGATRHLIALLDTCPRLTMLVTSQVIFRAPGWASHAVQPLADEDAVQLLMDRAPPAFAVTGTNAPVVFELCRRLDGLPLAIELAAAQLLALAPEALLRRAEHFLDILRRPTPEDVGDPRHETLRAAFAATYQGLSPEERAVFRRLAVFRGGCTLRAAEWVCSLSGTAVTTVASALSSLVHRSIVERVDTDAGDPDDQVRYVLHDTLRAYGLEQLEQLGETESAREHHLDYYVGLAEQAAPELVGPNEVLWRDRLEADHDNLRAAIQWALDREDAQPALRLTGALHRFWHLKAHWAEGRRYLEAALARSANPTSARAKALDGAAHLAYRQLDYDRARELLEERLALCRALDDPVGTASALVNLGMVAVQQGRYEDALSPALKGLRLARRHRYVVGHFSALHSLGTIARRQGKYRWARVLLEKYLALAQEIGEPGGIVSALVNLAALFLMQQDYDQARRRYLEALALGEEFTHTLDMPYCLEGLAVVAAREGDVDRSARLFGAADALRTEMDTPREPKEPFIPEGVEEMARARSAAWQEGRALALNLDGEGRVLGLALERVIQYARTRSSQDTSSKAPTTPRQDALA